MFFDINGWEFIIIAVIAAVLIGPERFPEYAVKLRRFVRELKAMADGAKAQLREQMGPEFDDIDWKAYDPRQYDPRRIVREALQDDTPLERDEPHGSTVAPAPTATATTAATSEASTAAPAPVSETVGATVGAVPAGGSADAAPVPAPVRDAERLTPYDDDAT